MYDIVLVSPPSRMINHYRPPLSLIYLGGYLTQKGLRVKIVDIPLHQQIRNTRFFRNREELLFQIKWKMIGEIATIDTRYIGISCMSPELEEVKEIIKEIRHFTFNRVPIIVGGIHPTLRPEDFDGIADTIVRGEGEVALYDVISNNKKGVIDGKIFDLDYISFPDYSLIDMPYYATPNPYAIRGVFIKPAYIMASRGCPSQCTFCVAKSLQPYFGIGRFRSPNYIHWEIEKLKDNYQIDGFYFVDDLFTLNKKIVMEFCRYHSNLIWGCSAKISTIDEEMLEAMSNSGCVQIDFGVERGSNQALKELKKGQTVEKVREVFKLCRKRKIRTFANFLVNIPNETDEDLKDIQKLCSEIKPTVVSFNVLQTYLGMEIIGSPITDKINNWAKRMNKKHNSIIKNILFHLSHLYWLKIEYFRQLGNLLREAINQKWKL